MISSTNLVRTYQRYRARSLLILPSLRKLLFGHPIFFKTPPKTDKLGYPYPYEAYQREDNPDLAEDSLAGRKHAA
jgi:hypothetical protein